MLVDRITLNVVKFLRSTCRSYIKGPSVCSIQSTYLLLQQAPKGFVHQITFWTKINMEYEIILNSCLYLNKVYTTGTQSGKQFNPDGVNKTRLDCIE